LDREFIRGPQKPHPLTWEKYYYGYSPPLQLLLERGKGGEASETKDDSKKNAGHDVLIPQCIRYNQNQGNFRA